MSENLILTGGAIRPDAFSELVEALGVADGKVAAYGTVDDVRAQLVGARVRDLDGATVIPGLVESHVHPIFFGLTLGWVDCRSPQNGSVGDIQAALRAELAAVPDGGWLRGWGYDDTLLAERRHLNGADLDAVSTDVPIVVTHISGHFLAANSAALRRCGVDARTPEPSEGHIVRDDAGEPTGLMWEMGAVALVLDAVPAPEPERLVEAARAAMDTAARRGMTTVHDLGIGLIAGLPELDTWRALAGRE